MPVFRLDPDSLEFPPPHLADESGLLAIGGDLRPRRLLLAYAMGIFPWSSYRGKPLWYSPDPRLVVVPEQLHVGRSLRKTIRKAPYRLTMDAAFDAVMRACSAIPRPDQDGTWISGDYINAFNRLHELGVAHSVEAWQDETLVGGVYGLSLGSAFFGESMFARADDASKIAFVALVQQLSRWEIHLIDCQVETEHLARFGAELWTRERFLDTLAETREHPTRAGTWRLDSDLPER